MKPINHPLQTMLDEMRILFNRFMFVKAHFQGFPPNSIGQTEFASSELHKYFGQNIVFIFPEGLTQEHLNKINDAAYYTKQNFIIRLCALFFKYQILHAEKKLNKNYPEWKYVDMLRRLINHFAKSSGLPNLNNPEHRKTIQKMEILFDIQIDKIEKFPLAIDKIIIPLYNGCTEYVKNVLIFCVIEERRANHL